MGIHISKMKLMTHNLLMCNRKGCTLNNFPLKIKCTESAITEVEYDPDLMARFIKKVDFPALTLACKDLNMYKYDFETLTPEQINEEDNLKFMHHCLFEVGLLEGFLICNNCNKEYIVNKGIPNLVLN